MSGGRQLPANNGITQVKYLKILMKVETDHLLDCQSVLILVGDLVLTGVEKNPAQTKVYEGKEPGAFVNL